MWLVVNYIHEKGIHLQCYEGHGRLVLCYEMSLYLSTGSIDKDSCPLQWWTRNEETSPCSARLAKNILCMQTTSVSSERVFSTSGSIASKRRCRLKPDTVNKITFLAKKLWMRAQHTLDIYGKNLWTHAHFKGTFTYYVIRILGIFTSSPLLSFSNVMYVYFIA